MHKTVRFNFGNQTICGTQQCASRQTFRADNGFLKSFVLDLHAVVDLTCHAIDFVSRTLPKWLIIKWVLKNHHGFNIR